MQLEASAGSLLTPAVGDLSDPFTSPTGYHRIAIDVMKALQSPTPHTLVVNFANHGALADLQVDDVVEVPCQVSRDGIAPLAIGKLPQSVRGLLLSVKAYERLAVEAAIERSAEKARLALLCYPIVGQWELDTEVLNELGKADADHLGFLQTDVA